MCYCIPYLPMPKNTTVSLRPSSWTQNHRGQRARSFGGWGLSGRILFPFPFLSWGEAGTEQGRSLLLFLLSSLPACKKLHFAVLNCFKEDFPTPAYSCGVQPEPSGLGGAGFGSWGHHWWQHTNGWLNSCCADTNQVQPGGEEAEKLILQVCWVLWLLSFPAARFFQRPLSK